MKNILKLSPLSQFETFIKGLIGLGLFLSTLNSKNNIKNKKNNKNIMKNNNKNLEFILIII